MDRFCENLRSRPTKPETLKIKGLKETSNFSWSVNLLTLMVNKPLVNLVRPDFLGGGGYVMKRGDMV